jgi:hypothetical protein
MKSNTFFLDFGGFTLSDIQLANQNGANIKSQYSRAARLRYDAVTCSKCACFIGDAFLSIYVDDSIT